MSVLPPKFYEPATAHGSAREVDPAALVLPAMGVPAGAYRRLATALAGSGTPAAVVEWRGTGASPVRPRRRAHWGYLELLDDETLGGLAATRAHWPGRPVVMVGHSLGGHIALMARARAPQGLAGVLLVAAGTPHYRAFGPALQRKLRLVVLLHRIVTPLVGHYPGHRLGFGGRQPHQLMAEWSGFVSTGRIRLHGADPFVAGPGPQAAAAARIPVRALSLGRDDYAPHRSTAELLRHAALAEHCIERYDGPGPTGHFDWLKEPQALARRIAAMVGELGSGRLAG